MENLTLMELVDEVRDLPLTVSDVLAQVIQECDNADASVSSLARIMARRPGAGGDGAEARQLRLLRLCAQIESLPDAVVLLGFASVKNLAITASITRLLSSDRDEFARDPLRALRSLARRRVGAAHPRPHEPHLGREGVRRRPAARPRPDRARLLPQGRCSASCSRRARARTCRFDESRRRSSASRTPSSARSSPRSGSSRRRSARPCATTTTPELAVVDPALARGRALRRLGRQAHGHRPRLAGASPSGPTRPPAPSSRSTGLDRHRSRPRSAPSSSRARRSRPPSTTGPPSIAAGGALATVTRCASSSSTRAATRGRTTMVWAPRSPRAGTTSGSRPAGSGTAPSRPLAGASRCRSGSTAWPTACRAGFAAWDAAASTSPT